MMKPADLTTKAFQEYREWLLKKLAGEIELRAGYARDEGWLREAVQSAAEIDPDITNAMVQRAMRTVLGQHRKILRSKGLSKALCASFRKTNERIERALHEACHVEVMASPENLAKIRHPTAMAKVSMSGQVKAP
jgi:hypothetical protein